MPVGAERFGGFLGALADAARERFLGSGRRRKFQTGDTLFHEGDASDWLAVLLSGRVKASYFTETGQEIVLGIRDPGDLLGDLSALDREPRSATVSAMEPVEVLTLTGDEFRAQLEAQPEIAMTLINTLISRLRDADVKRVEFGAYDSIGRVARRLVELADRFGEESKEGLIITVPLSQQELAGWTGSSRESVAKALQALRRLGWIDTNRRQFVVKDLAALRRRSS